MKKILLSVLLTVVFAVPAYSQVMDMPMKGHDMPMMGEGKSMMGHDMPMMGRDMPMMRDDRCQGHMGMGVTGGMEKMARLCLEAADRIGLTAEQIKKIRPIHREMQKRLVRFEADLKIAGIDFAEIMEVKDFDLEKATAALPKMADMITAAHLDMLKSMKEVRSILTDEQFEKMMKMRAHAEMGMMQPRTGMDRAPSKMSGKAPARKMMKK